jgi:hypothetical protein
MSREGIFAQPLTHPMRYYIFFSQKQDNLETIHSQVLNEAKLLSENKDSRLITWMNNFECPVVDISVRADSQDQSLHHIDFTFDKDGILVKH